MAQALLPQEISRALEEAEDSKMSMNFKTAMWGEVKTDIYAGNNCDEHKPFIEVLCDGDMESDTTDELAIHANRWPVVNKNNCRNTLLSLIVG